MMRLLALALLALATVQDAPLTHEFLPSQADPAVKAFDDANIAIAPRGLPADAPLAVFLTGTGGRPFDGPLLHTIAAQGYRVIALAYDNVPAVVQLCTNDPDPACAGDFREMRSMGTGKSKAVSNPRAEAIVPRLAAALRHLDSTAPAEGWGRYLDGGALRWERIVLSGLSQGAGMAAWLAKRHEVRRVVLFSSPWETTGTGADAHPAPWMAGTSVTPMARWQAAYNARELTVPLIKAGYAALGIPAGQIHLFALDLPAGEVPRGPNPYHPINIRDPRYAGEWRAMFGKGTDAPE